MQIALIIVSLALIVALGMLLFGSRGANASPSAQQQIDGEVKARQLAEAELDKKRKDLEDHKAQVADLKDQLKQAKRKLFEQKEGGKGDADLVKARAEVERSASMQLEVVRGELAQALHEVERLKAEAAGKGRRAPEKTERAPEAQAAAEPKRVIRELSEADKEKMDRLEREASKERTRAQELDREVKRLKGRAETQNRIYVVTKGELDLLKDKYKALEKRLNRTLLESDLIRRAVKDLEKQTGTAAGRTELTADEIAASDKKVEEKAAEDAKAAAQPTEASPAAAPASDAAVAEPTPKPDHHSASA